MKEGSKPTISFTAKNTMSDLKATKMKIFNDMSAYIGDLTNLIWNYIKNRELYPENAKLAVQPEIMANVIDDPSMCQFCDFYDLNIFIAKDGMGKPVPNALAIKNVANRYYKAG